MKRKAQTQETIRKYVILLHPHPNPSRDDGFTEKLIEQGYPSQVIALSPKPLNPLRNWNYFIAALDIIRALRVLMFHRKASEVVSIFESGGLFILLLRKLFLFSPPVILWDASISNPWRVVKTIQKITLCRYDGFLMLTESQLDVLDDYRKHDAVGFKIGYHLPSDFLAIAASEIRSDEVGDYVLAIGDDVTRDYETLYRTRSDKWPLVIKSKWKPSDLECRPHTTLVNERLETQQYVNLIAKARIVVIPMQVTRHPGGITTLYEAMALGKPVVVSHSPIGSEIVESHGTGLLVPVGDVKELQKVIDRLWEDPLLCRRLGHNGIKFINAQGTEQHLANNIAAAIRTLNCDS